jgi:hypothetical protein
MIPEGQCFRVLHAADTGVFARVHDQRPRGPERIRVAGAIAGPNGTCRQFQNGGEQAGAKNPLWPQPGSIEYLCHPKTPSRRQFGLETTRRAMNAALTCRLERKEKKTFGGFPPASRSGPSKSIIHDF